MKYDALIVLANEMDEFGALNRESIARAKLAAKLATDLPIPFIVTCGWAYRRDTKIEIACAFKDYLVDLGISESRILVETKSRDTVGDAVYTRKNISIPMGFREICVVTSNYHVPRTRTIFGFVYGADTNIDVEGASVSFDAATLSKEQSSLDAFRQTFRGVRAGDIDIIIATLGERHPFYNGEIFSKI